MSIVACKVYKDKIEIGADSIKVRYPTQQKNKNIKLCKINDMIIGSSGTVEEIALFRNYCMSHKILKANERFVFEFMCEFAEWKKKKIDKYDIENSYIIVFLGKAFHIHGFLIEEIKTYEAIGAGLDYALSVMYLGHDVEKAVETACELSVYCEKPINIMTMKKEKECEQKESDN